MGGHAAADKSGMSTQPVTQVVNIKHGDAFDVYCGHAGHGFDGYFGNQFKTEGVPREVSCALWAEYFYKRLREDPEFAARVQALKGKRLGCFCMPKKCHVMTIVSFLEGLDDNEQRENYSRLMVSTMIPLTPKAPSVESPKTTPVVQPDIFGDEE